jgi:tetratricopeptide (TPR) repeat protein
LLYLFLGNTAGKQRRLSEAQRYYTLALDVSPAYGRARLGLAELAFHRARGSCERNRVDATGLRRALKLYQAVLRSGEQSAGADLPTKVASGLGRTYLCLSQAEVANQWTEARAQLAKVIEDFNRGNQNVQELAAEAYAGLGLIYLPVGGAPSAKTQYRQAADAYQQAVRLSLDSRRQGVFLGTLAYIYSRLGDLPRACDAYDRAVKLDPDRTAEYQARRHRLRSCG